MEKTSSISADKESGDFLTVKDVVKRFAIGKRSLWSKLVRRRKPRYVLAVNGVSFALKGGATLVLLGESGSGKSTLGRMIVGLESKDEGEILLQGSPVGLAREDGTHRGKLQMVFQDSASSLAPFLKVSDCIAEPLSGKKLDRTERSAKVQDSMISVGLEASLISRKTSQLSGGQKQRVAIARAIVSDPSVIVLDEPTSSIDVSIQAQVLNLLVNLQKTKGFAYLLITHDPNVAGFMADRIAVMYLGKIVEEGPASKILSAPKHPYTMALLSSAPKLGERFLPAAPKGEPPSLIDLPVGCSYAPRCPYVMEICRKSVPPLKKVADDVASACYLN